MVRKVGVSIRNLFALLIISLFFRCPTERELLETVWNGDMRSKEHTELLAHSFDSKTLWEDYGIVSDIIVSLLRL